MCASSSLYPTFEFQVLLLHPLEENLLLDGCPPELSKLIFAPVNFAFWHVLFASPESYLAEVSLPPIWSVATL